MTYKEFKRNVFAVYSENYDGEDVRPIEYGIRRAKFEETKLQRLIALAEQTDFSTAKRKGVYNGCTRMPMPTILVTPLFCCIFFYRWQNLNQ